MGPVCLTPQSTKDTPPRTPKKEPLLTPAEKEEFLKMSRFSFKSLFLLFSREIPAPHLPPPEEGTLDNGGGVGLGPNPLPPALKSKADQNTDCDWLALIMRVRYPDFYIR